MNKDNSFLNSLLSGIPEQELSVSEQAMKNDKRIENAVVYKLTKGQTEIPTQASMEKLMGAEAGQVNQVSQEQLMDIMNVKLKFQDEITAMFKEFKSAIRRKSLTIEELEERVYSEHGVVDADWYDRSNPLLAEEGFKFEAMSEEDYKLMRDSYHVEEASDTAE
jgi:hypothetical protein